MAFAILTASYRPRYRVHSMMDQVAGDYSDRNDVKSTKHLRYRPTKRYLQFEFSDISEGTRHRLLFSTKVQAIEEREYVFAVPGKNLMKLITKWEKRTNPLEPLVIDGVVFHNPTSWKEEVPTTLFEDYFPHSTLEARLSSALLENLECLVKGEVAGEAAAATIVNVARVLYFNHPNARMIETFPGWKQHLDTWAPIQKLKKGHIYLAEYILDDREEKNSKTGPVLIQDEHNLPLSCFAINEAHSATIHGGSNVKLKDGKPIELHNIEMPLVVNEWLTSSEDGLRRYGLEIKKAFDNLATWRKRRLNRARKLLARLEKTFPKD